VTDKVTLRLFSLNLQSGDMEHGAVPMKVSDVDPLLGNGCEISNYKTAVAKYGSQQTNTFPRKQKLHCKRGAMFSTRSVFKCYDHDK
jgi:hypothetical protein